MQESGASQNQDPVLNYLHYALKCVRSEGKYAVRTRYLQAHVRGSYDYLLSR